MDTLRQETVHWPRARLQATLDFWPLVYAIEIQRNDLHSWLIAKLTAVSSIEQVKIEETLRDLCASGVFCIIWSVRKPFRQKDDQRVRLLGNCYETHKLIEWRSQYMVDSSGKPNRFAWIIGCALDTSRDTHLSRLPRNARLIMNIFCFILHEGFSLGDKRHCFAGMNSRNDSAEIRPSFPSFQIRWI